MRLKISETLVSYSGGSPAILGGRASRDVPDIWHRWGAGDFVAWQTSGTQLSAEESTVWKGTICLPCLSNRGGGAEKKHCLPQVWQEGPLGSWMSLSSSQGPRGGEQESSCSFCNASTGAALVIVPSLIAAVEPLPSTLLDQVRMRCSLKTSGSDAEEINLVKPWIRSTGLWMWSNDCRFLCVDWVWETVAPAWHEFSATNSVLAMGRSKPATLV